MSRKQRIPASRPKRPEPPDRPGSAAEETGREPATAMDGCWVFFDKSGKVVLRTDLLYPDPFSEGLASGFVPSKNKWGYIDKTGKMVIPAIYDYPGSFSEGLAAVAQSQDNEPAGIAPRK